MQKVGRQTKKRWRDHATKVKAMWTHATKVGKHAKEWKKQTEVLHARVWRREKTKDPNSRKGIYHS